MAEFIITFASAIDKERIIEIHPFAYMNLPSSELTDVGLIVLKGISPIRSALIAASLLPEQKLNSFSAFPTEKLSIPIETMDVKLQNSSNYNNHVSERLIPKMISELDSVSSGQVELHKQPFGFIIVIPVNKHENIAVAIDKEWPHNILQVNWVNRQNGSTEEVHIDSSGVPATNVNQLKKIFMEIKESRS